MRQPMAMHVMVAYRLDHASGLSLEMAIHRLMQNKAFAQEDIDRLVAAFEDALCVLDIKYRDDPIAEQVAKNIIEVAQTGVRDPHEITKLALVEFLSAKSPPRPLMPISFSRTHSAWAPTISYLRVITRSGGRRFGAANSPLRTCILNKAPHDMTARSIMPLRSPLGN